jgi:hypothetical protein
MTGKTIPLKPALAKLAAALPAPLRLHAAELTSGDPKRVRRALNRLGTALTRQRNALYALKFDAAGAEAWRRQEAIARAVIELRAVMWVMRQKEVPAELHGWPAERVAAALQILGG